MIALLELKRAGERARERRDRENHKATISDSSKSFISRVSPPVFLASSWMLYRSSEALAAAEA